MADRRARGGTGHVEESTAGDELAGLLDQVRSLLPQADLTPVAGPSVDDLGIAVSRLAAPDGSASLCSGDPADRAAHTRGKAFRDVVRKQIRLVIDDGSTTMDGLFARQ